MAQWTKIREFCHNDMRGPAESVPCLLDSISPFVCPLTLQPLN